MAIGLRVLVVSERIEKSDVGGMCVLLFYKRLTEIRERGGNCSLIGWLMFRNNNTVLNAFTIKSRSAIMER